MLNIRYPWGVATVLLCVHLFQGCRRSQDLGLEEREASATAASSSLVPSHPNGQTSLVARSSTSAPNGSAMQVTAEMPPTAPSPPQDSSAHAAHAVSQIPEQIPEELRTMIYVKTVLTNELNALKFGKQAWEQYFGDVGREPLLPSRIFTILDSPCPFWAGRKVRDTHLLVLIPSTVDGEPFTVNKLGELIKQKFPDNEEGYRRNSLRAKRAVGNETLPDAPYWLLMARDVLADSRDTGYVAQKELVAGHANRTGLPYQLPRTLEAATVILTHYVKNNGERLYGDDPWTYTRCLDVDENGDPIVVGGFFSGGLTVDVVRSALSHIGVSCCRKF